MDIPDEAWIAAHSVADADLDEVVRAAAPPIARSAQVRKLREMALRYHEGAALPQSEDGADRLTWMATMLEIEANALEAGATDA